ncbi:T-box transcription factor TBX20 [Striga asiatica]|uniref:T-box transcription factor TBX20 n=1 Tax=Striga asiatica TaxID=4170 RepID=A0A5A7RBA3_STRAF|nr:T-box transcription factor TBX20 [Striga asiatica]
MDKVSEAVSGAAVGVALELLLISIWKLAWFSSVLNRLKSTVNFIEPNIAENELFDRARKMLNELHKIGSALEEKVNVVTQLEHKVSNLEAKVSELCAFANDRDTASDST